MSVHNWLPSQLVDAIFGSVPFSYITGKVWYKPLKKKKKPSNRKLNQTSLDETEMHWVMQIGKEGMVSSLGRTKTQVMEEGLVTLSSSMYPQTLFPRGEMDPNTHSFTFPSSAPPLAIRKFSISQHPFTNLKIVS